MFHLFALCADWTLVALTAGFKKFLLGGRGRRGKKGRGGEKPWKEKNLDKHKLVYNFKILQELTRSAFQLLPGSHPFLSLKSLLLICAKCLMLWDHSEYHLSDTAQGINNGNSFFFFPLPIPFWFQVSLLPFPSSFTQILKPRAGKWNILVMLNTCFLFGFSSEELICNNSSPVL